LERVVGEGGGEARRRRIGERGGIAIGIERRRDRAKVSRGFAREAAGGVVAQGMRDLRALLRRDQAAGEVVAVGDDGLTRRRLGSKPR
jgi:hypothetical protein